ncbi:MAG: hypothetical protein AAF667_19690 [Pseudomonadota bacterium]
MIRLLAIALAVTAFLGGPVRAQSGNPGIEQMRSQLYLRIGAFDPPIDLAVLNDQEVAQLFLALSTRKRFNERRAAITSVRLRAERRMAAGG